MLPETLQTLESTGGRVAFDVSCGRLAVAGYGPAENDSNGRLRRRRASLSILVSDLSAMTVGELDETLSRMVWEACGARSGRHLHDEGKR